MTFESESVLFHLDINTETLLNGIVVAGFLLLIILCHRLTRQGTPCGLKPSLSRQHYSPAPPSHPTLPPFLRGGGGGKVTQSTRGPVNSQREGLRILSSSQPQPRPPQPAVFALVGGGGIHPLSTVSGPPFSLLRQLFSQLTQGGGGPPIPPPLSRQMGPLSSEGSRQER